MTHIHHKTKTLHITPNQLKPGFIFIPYDDDFIPNSYRASYLGANGYIGKIDSSHSNGWDLVTIEEYLNS